MSNHHIPFPLVEAYNTYGIYPIRLKKELETKFNLPNVYKPCLQKYFLLYWSPEYTFNEIALGSNDTLIKNGISYKVKYLSNIVYTKEDSQLKLSFRVPVYEYIEAGIVPIVLIDKGGK